jgi:hypothetical protein
MRWFWLLLGIVVFGLMLGWMIYPTRLISREYTGYESLKNIGWDNLTSGVLASAIRVREQVLPKRSAYKEEGVTRVSFNPDLLGKYGYVGLTIEPKMMNDTGNKDYIFSKPYRLLGYAATRVGESEMVVMYVGWRSRSGRYGIVTYVIPKAIYVSGNFASRMKEYLEDETKQPLMPVTQIATEEKCLYLTLQNKEYCKWFIENSSKIAELALDWATMGELPSELSHYPLLVNW